MHKANKVTESRFIFQKLSFNIIIIQHTKYLAEFCMFQLKYDMQGQIMLN